MPPSLEELVKQGEGDRDAVDLGDGMFMSRNIANSYLVTTPDGDMMINTGTDFEAPDIKSRFSRVSPGPLRMIPSPKAIPTTSAGGASSAGPGSRRSPRPTTATSASIGAASIPFTCGGS